MEPPVLVYPRMRLRVWHDPAVEANGFEPSSEYVEVCWLPVLGPTPTWLYRRMAAYLVTWPDGVTIDMAELARSIGIGAGLGRHAQLARSLNRLIRFGVIQQPASELFVRALLAPITETELARLPAPATTVHRRATARR